ncbi:hypothetical protein GGS21DRAFT_518210 [Xylaria nigripes]|nr:hypothetical protein GGS21DRAFT_518210 [Xylaria nigripes]
MQWLAASVWVYTVRGWVSPPSHRACTLREETHLICMLCLLSKQYGIYLVDFLSAGHHLPMQCTYHNPRPRGSKWLFNSDMYICM